MSRLGVGKVLFCWCVTPPPMLVRWLCCSRYLLFNLEGVGRSEVKNIKLRDTYVPSWFVTDNVNLPGSDAYSTEYARSSWKICLAITAVISFLFFPDGLSSGESTGGGEFNKWSWNKTLQSAGWLRIQETSLSVHVGLVSHCTEGPFMVGVAATPNATTFPSAFPPLFLLAVAGTRALGSAEGAWGGRLAADFMDGFFGFWTFSGSIGLL